MTSEEILAIFYDNITCKKNDLDGNLKKIYHFLREGKDLNFDILDTKMENFNFKRH